MSAIQAHLYTHTHTDTCVMTRDTVLTARCEVMDESVFSGMVSAGMQRGKSRLSPSRADRSYLYPSHLSPPSPGSANRRKDW